MQRAIFYATVLRATTIIYFSTQSCVVNQSTAGHYAQTTVETVMIHHDDCRTCMTAVLGG